MILPPLNDAQQSSPQPADGNRSATRVLRGLRRRAATAMEYLFMMSLIIIVAMTTIGYLGQMFKRVSQSNSDAIEKAVDGSMSSGS